MKTIQITLDDALLLKVDRVCAELQVTRSEFIREALQLAIKQQHIVELETHHAQGYAQHPTSQDDVAEWTDEQDWGDV